MKIFKVGELRLDEKALSDDLGENNTPFVGSSTDMFAEVVPIEWINRVLLHCCAYPKNTYLFQSKNPQRFIRAKFQFPPNSIFGTTIETNKQELINSSAPIVQDRQFWIGDVEGIKMVSIEPIMDFDLDVLMNWMKDIQPKFVSIGADSKGHNLTEPSWDKVQELIKELRKFTEVKIKDNLNRLKQNTKCEK
jgi:protein gp37